MPHTLVQALEGMLAPVGVFFLGLGRWTSGHNRSS
jgi:hypothetical protein